MDATSTAAVPRPWINRFLPYWAVFQADFKATFNSWIYRVWVLLSVARRRRLSALPLRRQAGFRHDPVGPGHDRQICSHWVVYGSVTLMIALTAGAICAERGTIADSVLSRGISRYQYFLGKWHARLTLVLATYFVQAAAGDRRRLLHVAQRGLDDSRQPGGDAGGGVDAGVRGHLRRQRQCDVEQHAGQHRGGMDDAVWRRIFACRSCPARCRRRSERWQNLPNVLKGLYDWNALSRTMLTSLGVSAGTALVGMICFSRQGRLTESPGIGVPHPGAWFANQRDLQSGTQADVHVQVIAVVRADVVGRRGRDDDMARLGEHVRHRRGVACHDLRRACRRPS